MENTAYSSVLNQTTILLSRTLTPKLNGEETQDVYLAEDLADIVMKHALGAAAAGLGMAWLPGAGSTASMVAMTGFIWSMYFRINHRIGLKMSKVMVKSIASGMLSNMAQAAISIVGYAALSSVLSLTGIGALLSSAMMAALDYAIVLVGGVIYLKCLNGLFSVGKNPEDMSQEEIKIAMGDA